MMDPWKKIENENGLPLYFNDATKEKQWNHPKFSEIKQRLDECNYVRYSTYRVALKFRALQQALSMDLVPLTLVGGVFERHKLGSNEGGLFLDCYDLEAILHDIYFACDKQNQGSIDVETSTELMLNLLINIYDSEKTGKIQVLSAKLILAILSSYNTADLFRFLFELSADHNYCVTRLRLQLLLKKITEIVDFLHEDSNFGRHLISSSLDCCFSQSPGLIGITEGLLVSWFKKGPQILSWLPILSKIKLAETVHHNTKCSSCKLKPFTGLRYTCLKCANYKQCQRCFFTGKTDGAHKLSHSMREHCVEENGKKNENILLKKILGILICSSSKNRPKKNDVGTNSTGKDNKFFNSDNQNDEVTSDISDLSSPLGQLQIIIRQLEKQNRELNTILSSGDRNAEEIKIYLRSHKTQVSNQINKLKVLKEYLKLSDNESLIKKDKIHIQSTPRILNGAKSRILSKEMEFLSPIAQTDENCSDSDNINTSTRNTLNSNRSIDVFPENTVSNTTQYTLDDISSWIGDHPSQRTDIFKSKSSLCLGRKMHTDLDKALVKLEQILANNFTLDESLVNYDNGQLKYAVSEVEGMLTSFIDTVETSRASSTHGSTNKF
ncbi:dystrophin-related protein 2-like [Coccinella septempunctata]|uniref:dystrophin-related protein 2-like n=1 Tax=Coccinella septempunctata TaxID=41139 RepID=UPI001D067422|nr:dystrophin-related protein 2-like [Coccinella septempunctata]XP_044745433.1 dystrophin-related protein 2-like [Coccinella septempunctata]